MSEMQYLTDGMVVEVDEGLREFLEGQTDDEILTLRQSIRKDGIRDAIIIWEETGIIVDGMTRYRLAKSLETDEGIKVAIPYIYKSFEDILAVKKFMLEVQFGRRNLTDRQRGMKALVYKGLLEEEALKRVRAGVKVPDGEFKGHTEDILEEKCGVSKNTVQRLAAIQKKGVEEVQTYLIRNSKVPVSTMYELVDLPEERQKEIVKEVVLSSGEVDVGKLKTEVKVASELELKDAKFKEATKDLSSEEVQVEKAFDSFLFNLINSVRRKEAKKDETKLKVGDDIAKDIQKCNDDLEKMKEEIKNNWELTEKDRLRNAARTEAFKSIPLDIKKMLIAREVSAYDVEALLNNKVPILPGMAAAEISVKANKIREELREKAWLKIDAEAEKAKNNQDAEALKRAEMAAMAEIEAVKEGIKNALVFLQKKALEGRFMCPVHGPECKVHFDCGLGVDEALKIAVENISILGPEYKEIEVKEEENVNTADGKVVKVTKYKTGKVRVKGSCGKRFREEV